MLFAALLLLSLIPCVIAQVNTPTPIPSPSPLPQPPYAVITYPSTTSNAPSVSVVSPCVGGFFSLVGLQPGQIVHVVVQFPTKQALQLVNLDALDGGLVLPPTAPAPAVPPLPSAISLPTDASAALSFTFIAARQPGKDQIRLLAGSQEFGLQFWVFDPHDAQNSPSAITPSNPYPAATN